MHWLSALLFSLDLTGRKKKKRKEAQETKHLPTALQLSPAVSSSAAQRHAMLIAKPNMCVYPPCLKP